MRAGLKRIANGSCMALMLPAVLLYGLGALVLGAEKAFPGWSQALSLLPGLTGVYLRRAFYRLVLPQFAADASLGFGTVFSRPGSRIGAGVFTGVYCCLGEVVLEDDALLGSHVSITSGNEQHGTERLDIPIRMQPGTWRRVTIGRDSWIGERALIMADVGQHCIIGAGAVVTRVIPNYAVAVGVPARVIGFRNGASGGVVTCQNLD